MIHSNDIIKAKMMGGFDPSTPCFLAYTQASTKYPYHTILLQLRRNAHRPKINIYYENIILGWSISHMKISLLRCISNNNRPFTMVGRYCLPAQKPF